MTNPEEKLTVAGTDDLASSLAYALRFESRKRWHDADELMSHIVARRLVRYLDRAGYVVMKKPSLEGHGQNSRGFGQKD